MNTAELIKFPAAGRGLQESRVADLDDGFTRIANELLEAVMHAGLSQHQLLVFLAVMRKTYGFNKKSDWVSNEQLSELTGILPHKCSAAKSALVKRGILTQNGRVIGINKTVSEWSSLPVKGTEKKPYLKKVTLPESGKKSLPESGNAHYPNQVNTKDNITKDKKDNITPIVPTGDECEKPPGDDVIQEEPRTDPVRLVFTHWQTEHHHPTAKLDDKRRKRIKARLAEGFTADELCRAISGAKGDPWLMGKNPSRKRYDGIETLLRDAAQVEKLRDLAGDAHAMAIAQGQYSATTARNLETLQRWAGGSDSGELF
ncbi:replication protein [Klebsiella sp. WOUb02]|uniref:replication protein n=1 Tax=Klebsiella sp. WOUb02 TaxID=3161071 RepID=UPI003CE92456